MPRHQQGQGQHHVDQVLHREIVFRDHIRRHRVKDDGHDGGAPGGDQGIQGIGAEGILIQHRRVGVQIEGVRQGEGAAQDRSVALEGAHDDPENRIGRNQDDEGQEKIGKEKIDDPAGRQGLFLSRLLAAAGLLQLFPQLGIGDVFHIRASLLNRRNRSCGTPC